MLMAKQGVVFLMYHELGVPGREPCHREPGYTRYVVPQAEFVKQMQRMGEEGWRGISVGQAVPSFGSKCVSITFDDGCETDLLCAAPALKNLGFGATFYITHGFLGGRGYLSETQVRELHTIGFEIGCHSQTHPYLTDVEDQRLRDETTGAKQRLEQIIGAKVEHFSCPGGRWNDRVLEAVKTAGFRTMATSRSGFNYAKTDPFQLKRVAVLGTMNVEQVVRSGQGEGLLQTRVKKSARGLLRGLLGNSAYDSLRSVVLRQK
jgi:peptidoglycan/xylan/chitin deacetylase (PgdA/CDA1 family)